MAQARSAIDQLRRREAHAADQVCKSRARVKAIKVWCHYDSLFARAARLNPPPNLPPFLSSNGLVVDRDFVKKEERGALLAYLKKL